MKTRDRVLRAIEALQRRTGFSPLQKEIAAEAGICRGNLTRALGHLEDEGRIVRRRSHIKIVATQDATSGGCR